MPGDGMEQPVAIVISETETRLLIEGTEVLICNSSTAAAVAMLFGLTYVLNLKYPKELKFTWVFSESLNGTWYKIDDPQSKSPLHSAAQSVTDWQSLHWLFQCFAEYARTHTHTQDGKVLTTPISSNMINSFTPQGYRGMCLWECVCGYVFEWEKLGCVWGGGGEGAVM